VELNRIPLDAVLPRQHHPRVPDGEARLMAYLFDEILDGRNAAPTDGVERVLGRPARSFGEAVAFEQRSSCLQV
jgi:hypothetical protein